MGVGAGYTVELKSISLGRSDHRGLYSYADQTFSDEEIHLKKGSLHGDSGRLEVSKVKHPYWGFSDIEFPCADIDLPLPEAVIFVDELDESQVLDLISVLLLAGATSGYEGDDLDDADRSLEYLKSLLVGFTGTLDPTELFDAIDTDINDEVDEYISDFTEWNSGVMSRGYLWCKPDGLFTFEGATSYSTGLLDQNSKYTNGVEFKTDDFMISLRSDELAEAISECHDLYDDDDESGDTYDFWLEDLRNRY